MLKAFTLIALLTVSTIALGQNNSFIKRNTYKAPEVKQPIKKENKLLYGPLPYRTLQETVGETYMVLPLMDIFKKDGYKDIFKKGEQKNISQAEGEGKFLKLTSVNDSTGHFTDSAGTEYLCKIYQNTFSNLTPLKDLEDSRKLLLNKPLWLNIDSYVLGDPYAEGIEVKDVRFTKVMVADVIASFSNNAPVFIIFKTPKGEIAYDNANLSGTNSDLDINFFFTEKFFTQDPQITYKLSPKVWANVKAGKIELGMPSDAIYLMQGRPRSRNNTTTASTFSEQWVYGEGASQHYFYFTNGKLTSWSN